MSASSRSRPTAAATPSAACSFVDVAIRRDARIGFGDARAVEQAGFAAIACFCVDFHQRRLYPQCHALHPTHHLPAPRLRQRFRRQLLAWYRKHGRDLPWRKTDDPYHILVSEIMLQQTQVDRVLPKYHEWLDKYPSLEALAAAPADEVTTDLVSAGLQHPARAAAVDRARSGRPVRRRAAVRR